MDGFTTPNFEASQDDDHVYLRISCAGAVGTPNIAVEGRIFGFHLEPYYLPLVLPGAVTKVDSELAGIDVVQSQAGLAVFSVTLNKVQRGEHFDGLSALQPQLMPEEQLKQAMADAEQSKGFFQPASAQGESEDAAAKTLLQQALRSQGLVTVTDNDGEAAMDDEVGAANSTRSTTREAGAGSAGFGFGLGGKWRGALIPAGCADPRGVLEVPNPEAVDVAAREAAAVQFEEARWDEGMYMDNLLDVDGEVQSVIAYQPALPNRHEDVTASTAGMGREEVERLGVLLELLFAYSYDERTNEGEATVESGWTIAKLSRTLSASAPARVIGDEASEMPRGVVVATLIGCMRRALTVPLYRHWALACRCIADTLERLACRRAHVVDCLVQITQRLEAGEDAILARLAEVWVTPLLEQLPSDQHLEQLRQCAEEIVRRGDSITKHAVGGEPWDLEVLESAAWQAFHDGEGGFV